MLTERGWKTLTAFIFLALWGVVSLDPIILILSAVGLGYLFFSYLDFRRVSDRITENLTFEPWEIDASIIAGEVFRQPLMVNSKLDLKIRLIEPFKRSYFEPDTLETGETLACLVFEPEISGKYIVDTVEIEYQHLLNLFKNQATLPLKTSIETYPRIYPVLLEAATFLTEAGEAYLGEQPTETPGSGFEYLWSRPYVPGDPPKRIDWKATARNMNLIVKDHRTHMAFL